MELLCCTVTCSNWLHLGGSAGIAQTLCVACQFFQAETAVLYFVTVAGARETDNTSSRVLCLSVKNNDRNIV